MVSLQLIFNNKLALSALSAIAINTRRLLNMIEDRTNVVIVL